MATKTLGTTANNSLTAITFAASVTDADFATIMLGIKDDKVKAAGSHPIYPNAFARGGLLTIPNRGIIQVLPGDYVAIDNNGWPILVSGDTIAYGSTLWVHS